MGRGSMTKLAMGVCALKMKAGSALTSATSDRAEPVVTEGH
jgi:hypothetical protein